MASAQSICSRPSGDYFAPATISTPSALASEIRPHHGRVIRIVEGQHLISTNRIAATSTDQALLEALADDFKPQLPEAARRLPWLLASPFRYGLGRPSRFRAPDVLPGIFYASEDIEIAVSEAAYSSVPTGRVNLAYPVVTHTH